MPVDPEERLLDLILESSQKRKEHQHRLAKELGYDLTQKLPPLRTLIKMKAERDQQVGE